jgi:hypothetical protein
VWRLLSGWTLRTCAQLAGCTHCIEDVHGASTLTSQLRSHVAEAFSGQSAVCVVPGAISGYMWAPSGAVHVHGSSLFNSVTVAPIAVRPSPTSAAWSRHRGLAMYVSVASL